MHLKAFLLTILSLLLLSVALTGCAQKTQKTPPIVLTPPASLLNPCEKPEKPENLIRATTTKAFAIEATRYIIELEQSYDECAGKVEAISKWSDEITAGVR